MNELASLRILRNIVFLIWILLWSLSSLGAEFSPDSLPKPLEGIGIDQLINEQVPVDLPFVDETGKNILLSDYLGRKPAILVLAYYECPRLCTMVLNGLGDALSKANLEVGEDYEVITVSINPKDSPKLALAKKASYVTHYGHGNGDGWHFLTGTPQSIANVNGVSDKDQSALMYAAEVCNIPVAKALLSNGAKLSLRDKNGRTALMFAAMGSCSPVISLMTVFTGASIHAIDHSGRTALDYANDAASLYEEGAPITSVRLIKKALWSSENLHKKTTHLSHLRGPGLIEASPKAFPLVKHS